MTIDHAYECGEGWRPMVTKLDEKLRTLSPRYEIQQIKEKFGTLRFYAKYVAEDGASPLTREIFYDLIVAAEANSSTVCEECGRSAYLRKDLGWFKTLCAECYVRRKSGKTTASGAMDVAPWEDR